MSRRNFSQGDDDADDPATTRNHGSSGDAGHAFQRGGFRGSGQNSLRGSQDEEYYGTSQMGHDASHSAERDYAQESDHDYSQQNYTQQNFNQGAGPKAFTQRYSVGHDDVHSPMSSFSTHSHEVKQFLHTGGYEEESLDRAAYSDYSHISIRAKPVRNGCGSAASHTASVTSDHMYKENYAPVPSHPHPPPSSVISEPLHPRSYHGGSNVDISSDPLRRKSWSPPALRQNSDHAGYYNVRSCRSNDMADWNAHYQETSNVDVPYTHSKGYPSSEGASENLPPRLAPISGVLTEKPGSGRNLIRPIAFKPLHGSHGNIRSPPQGTQRLPDHKEGCVLPSGPPPPYSQHPSALQQPPPPSFRAVNSYSHMPRVGDLSVNSDRSANYVNDSLRPADLVESPLGSSSLDASRLSGHSHQSGSGAQALDVVGQTPSPSDSGVGELEAMLREKDAEILTLRQVMDRNERAIFQVYEEKKNAWLRDLREMKEDYEQKLKTAQRRAGKAEQSLSMQVCKLQQEKQQSLGEYEALFAEKEALKRQCATFQHQLHDVRMQLEAATSKMSPASATGNNSRRGSPAATGSSTNLRNEGRRGSEPQPDSAEFERMHQRLAVAEEEVSARNKEVINLRSQLHTLQTDVDTKNKDLTDKFREIVAKTEELKSVRSELSRLSAGEASVCDGGTQTSHSDSEVSTEENVKPSMLTQKDQIITGLQEEIRALQERIQELERKLQGVDSIMETERLQWLEEKNKVIRYQKQLQLNYVQMQRKNTVLEAEVEQLTLELESRDLKLIALNGDESVC